MTRRTTQHLIAGIASGLLFFTGGTPATVRAAEEPVVLQKDAPKKDAPQGKAKKKAGGRLPPGFGDLVTEEQRQKIYAIQAQYAEQLENLQKQLDDLRDRRDAEVEGVLTPDQKKQLEANRAARKKKGPPKKDGFKKDDFKRDGLKKEPAAN